MTCKTNTLGGFGVALVTPFTSDYEVDYSALEKLIEFQIAGGVDFLVTLGTTAETPTLTEEEQIKIVAFVQKVVDKRVPIVVGMGGNATRELCKKIRRFPMEGISAILSVAPYYNKPSQEGLYAHFSEVVEASSKPVILYNIPGRTGVNMQVETVLRLSQAFPDKVIGIKEASGSITQIERILKQRPSNFALFSGDDSSTLSYISMGGDGVISVIGNALPKEFGGLVSLCRQGKFAEAAHVQRSLVELYELLFVEGNPSGIKSALHCMGLIENVLRLPLVPCTPVVYSRIRQFLSRIGYCRIDNP
ncbi:4-hydroxy-tetrahydrodipicolinate synthase [Porphyromonas sp. COT-108 OH1349]|uniref:4-hydroxy-tetrahydrodipicolinate synthase n=1 Tax=Porphyromonas sp. COT-108 OH1349 TaxID=1537504 RepID=UPI00052DAE7C|nr:4-hydroxy-tetrahydrodipicolinate synthase [Porphyromonas sp. COT-108 OH1349]KGN68597.1 dihydrodipicolinate synthase [Porphyromonas sp. COT-108 OH1349]